MHVLDWTIPGADNQPIIGNTHHPASTPRGIIIIAHGFKGYKDYGMFPRIAQHMADAGFIALRFNFSHSGMTNDIDTFAQPELFERDTWNKQVEDLTHVIKWSSAQYTNKAGAALPYVLFGHSRGGVTALLTAGRVADDATCPQPAAVVTAAAPDRCCSLSQADADRLLSDGSLPSPSSRTGQTLRIGSAFLQEQLDDPQQHDVLAMVKRITCPLLILHGDADANVPIAAATHIAHAAGGRAVLQRIASGDHVFNTPNPLPATEPPSPQLHAMLTTLVDFAIANTRP